MRKTGEPKKGKERGERERERERERYVDTVYFVDKQ